MLHQNMYFLVKFYENKLNPQQLTTSDFKTVFTTFLGDCVSQNRNFRAYFVHIFIYVTAIHLIICSKFSLFPQNYGFIYMRFLNPNVSSISCQKNWSTPKYCVTKKHLKQ